MNFRAVVVPALCAASLSIAAASSSSRPTISWKPPSEEDERPLATDITVSPRGSDIAVRAAFNRRPYGEDCKNRCANLTVYLDTDNNPGTGLQLGKEAAETGADLSVNIQGAKNLEGSGKESILRAKVRFFPSGTTNTDDGTALADYDIRRDSERLSDEENTVFLLVDATDPSIPSGKQMRVVFHPPGRPALKGMTTGMLAHGGGKVEILKKGLKR